MNVQQPVVTPLPPPAGWLRTTVPGESPECDELLGIAANPGVPPLRAAPVPQVPAAVRPPRAAAARTRGR